MKRRSSWLTGQVWIDAIYLKEREGGRIVSTAAIIVVGVNTDGRREVLGVATGPSEAEPFWKAFLRPLADRGLRAASKVFSASQQRRRVHWMRNAFAMLRQTTARCRPLSSP